MVCYDRPKFGQDTIWKSGIWGSKILRKSPLKFLAMDINNQKLCFDIQVHLNKLESGGKVHLFQ